MSRNEDKTCRELIEPALTTAGWNFDRQLPLGPGPVNIAEGSMYDPSQRLILDYLLRFGHIPLAVLEAKAETEPAADGIQQGQRYAGRLAASIGDELVATNHDVAALRESILRDAFAGKLVPHDPSDEPAAVLLERIRADRDAAERRTAPRTKSRRRAPHA